MRQSTALDSAARRLHELHQIGRPLLLVNVWDVSGARAVLAAGSPAIATSSVAMASARGGTDDNRDSEAAFAQLQQITAAVDVPVTADVEGGYGLAPDDLVDALLDAGAVGCNLEDTDHAAGDRLFDAQMHANYLAGVRAAADHRGVGIVLNARIDAIIRHPRRDPAEAMDEVLRRARLYIDAGADCVYPISLRDPALVSQIVNELDRPVNVNPSEPLAALVEAGAARISLGGGVHNWMMGELERRAERLLAGDATAFSPT
jgi:2-methylisocitrate lyase-like PEP mutase family enzyme